ncbi:MAG: flagellar hook assembly protein FlgD [Synergistaceae bacterium]|nr:flagellar hook assembly protein FlgD [Synergistaceae bacterium]
MAVTGVNNSYYVPQVQREIKQDLDKDAFLRLLVTQLANQDPTNPMEDREFIAQMAQFSSLEQMVNMTKQIEKMAATNQTLAVSYIGRLVAFYQENADSSLPPNEIAALVKAVWFDPQQGVILETDKGDIKLEQVTGVA